MEVTEVPQPSTSPPQSLACAYLMSKIAIPTFHPADSETMRRRKTIFSLCSASFVVVTIMCILPSFLCAVVDPCAAAIGGLMTVASAVCAAVYYYARRTKQCTDLAVFLQLEMIGIVFVFMTWLSEQATVPLGALVCFCVVLLLVVCRVHWVFLLISTMITFFSD